MGGNETMTEQRYIRNVVGQIYDMEDDKFYDEEYGGKPIGYDDDVVELLNEQDQKIKELTNFKNKVFSILDEEIQYKKGLQELSEEQEMDMSLEKFTFEHAMLLTIKRKLEEIE